MDKDLKVGKKHSLGNWIHFFYGLWKSFKSRQKIQKIKNKVDISSRMAKCTYGKIFSWNSRESLTSYLQIILQVDKDKTNNPIEKLDKGCEWEIYMWASLNCHHVEKDSQPHLKIKEKRESKQKRKSLYLKSTFYLFWYHFTRW